MKRHKEYPTHYSGRWPTEPKPRPKPRAVRVITCPYCDGTSQSKAGGECGFCDNGQHVVGT